MRWVKGYEDNSFKASQAVSKAEALKILLNSQSIVITQSKEIPFKDVTESDWYFPYVNTAYTLGILEESDTLFEPNAGMKRAGFCENLYRLLN